MRTIGLASGRAQLSYTERAALEKSALEGFSEEREWGGGECRQILRDWFPRLLERVSERKGADAAISDYNWEIDDAFPVLESLRWAFSANEQRTSSRRYKIWAWPTLALEGRFIASPADPNQLADALADYVERPWLQHSVIDGAAINALLFSTLASTIELHDSGELFGQPKLNYVLGGSNVFKVFGIGMGLTVARFFLRWIMLPAIAVSLTAMGYETAAGLAIGVWLVYLLYRLVTVPRQQRARMELRKKQETASQLIAAMMKAWQYSNGAVINPSRLKELVLAAEQQYSSTFTPELVLALEAKNQGALFKPVLHTLIDRAIMHDPTALLTRRQSAPS
jgi:hypothetical protein